MGRKKILITGAAGRVGSVLSEALKGRYDLVLVDVLPLSDEEGVERYCRDVCDEAAMARCCVGVHTVVHLAIGGNVKESREELEAVNVGGAQCVMRVAAQAGCARVIFASSITIERLGGNDYADAKREVELWAEGFSKEVKMSILCLRLGNVLSPRHPVIWPGHENLSFVLTHRDLIQLVECSLSVSMDLHYGVFSCVSLNEPMAFDIAPARQALGFDPQDNAYFLAAQNARCLKGRLRSVKRLVKGMLRAMVKA